MFGGEAIGASEGVADDAGGEGAAAIGERGGGFGVVAEKGVAGEEAVAGGEVVIEAAVELGGDGSVVADAAEVIGGGIGDVGGGVAADDGEGGAVQADGGDGIGGEGVAEPRGAGAAGGGGVEDGGCEDTGALRGGGHGAGADDAGVEAGGLVIGKEESPVFAEGAAEDEAELIAAEAGLRAGSGKEVAGVEFFVAEELKESAVELVGAGLLVDHDDAAVGAAIFGGVAVDLDAELLDGVDDGVEGDLAGFGLEDGDAVVDVLADAGAGAVDAGEEVAGGEIDAGAEGDQGDEVAAVEGEGDDFALFDDEADGAAAGLEEGRGGGDEEGLGGVAQGEGEMEGGAAADLEREAIAGERGEAVLGDVEGIGAGGQGEELEESEAAGEGGGLQAGEGVGEAEFGLCDGEAGGVEDGAEEFGIVGLGGERGEEGECEYRLGETCIQSTVMLARHSARSWKGNTVVWEVRGMLRGGRGLGCRAGWGALF